MSQSINGREQSRDQAVQTNATVLDGTGLAVTALSGFEAPDAVTEALRAARPRAFPSACPPRRSICVCIWQSNHRHHTNGCGTQPPDAGGPRRGRLAVDSELLVPERGRKELIFPAVSDWA